MYIYIYVYMYNIYMYIYKEYIYIYSMYMYTYIHKYSTASSRKQINKQLISFDPDHLDSDSTTRRIQVVVTRRLVPTETCPTMF